MLVSLDGYFEGVDHDISWHHVDDEFNQFASKQMEEMGLILFGHRTYDLMRDFWPKYQPEDKENEVVTERMANLPKIVFSKTLDSVAEEENWKNVQLIKDNIQEEAQKLKNEDGKDIAILGSNNLCVSLMKLGLVDELRIMVNPVIIGQGTRLFEGLTEKLELKLSNSRTFGNGNVLLYYQIEK